MGQFLLYDTSNSTYLWSYVPGRRKDEHLHLGKICCKLWGRHYNILPLLGFSLPQCGWQHRLSIETPRYCGGQLQRENKNTATVKCCVWLGKAGGAKKAALLFLVKGHTENDYDRMFNLLKRGLDNLEIWK